MATASPSGPPPKPRFRRWLRLSLLFTAGPYFGLVILLTIFQRSLIYVPRRVPHIPISTAALPHASAEAIRVPTEDGLELHGWWFTSHDSDSSVRGERRGASARGKPLILYFCGNAGHRGYRLEEFDLLTAWGADVLCCDYRGYGDNAGRPSEEGLAADARAVWNYATQIRAIRPEQIVLFGESLGGAVAIRLAADLCKSGMPPAGLVTRSTFSSLGDVAAPVFPWLPVRWMLWDRYESNERIGSVSCPIALIHGKLDSIVPHKLGVKLFAATPPRSSDGTPKRMVDLPSADHNDVLETEGRAFGEAVDAFLRVVCPRRDASGE